MLVKVLYTISAVSAAAIFGLERRGTTSVAQVETNFASTAETDNGIQVIDEAGHDAGGNGGNGRGGIIGRQVSSGEKSNGRGGIIGRQVNPLRKRAALQVFYQCPGEDIKSPIFEVWGQWNTNTRKAEYTPIGTTISRLFPPVLSSGEVSTGILSSVSFNSRKCEVQMRQSCSTYVDGQFHATISDTFEFSGDTGKFPNHKDPTIRINCTPSSQCADGQQSVCKLINHVYVFSDE